MSRERTTKRILTPTLFAFVFSVLLPFFVASSPLAVSPNTKLQSENSAAPLFAEKILICTADGFKWVNVGNLPAEGPQTPTQTQFECYICYLAAQTAVGILPVFLGALLIYEEVETPVYEVQFDAALYHQLYRKGFPARAPPFVA